MLGNGWGGGRGGVGEDSSESDVDYEASSEDSDDSAVLSDYEETDAEDEDLCITRVKGKSQRQCIWKF